MQAIFDQIFVASDHAGSQLQQQLHVLLQVRYPDIKITILTPEPQDGDDYPLAAKLLADSLSKNPESAGIAICGSGQGICMALNRYSFIRAAVTERCDIVKLARLHNDANVLCLPARMIDTDQAAELVESFIFTEFSKQDRHTRRRQQLSDIGYGL